MHTILLTAASGNIGQYLIPSLLHSPSQSVKLILPTSNASKLAKYDENANIHVVQGELSDPKWVEGLLREHQVETVFLNLFGTDELFTVFGFLDAMRRVGCVRHVVYLSACGSFLTDPSVTLGWMCPHTKIKPPVEAALQHLKTFTHTVIGPSLFFENDNKVKDAILHGHRWVEPFGDKGASRVAVRDIADAVLIAIEDGGRKWGGKKIMVGSGKMFTGEECAELWSNALGEKITAVPSNQESLDKLEEVLRGKLGPLWGRDLALLYEGIMMTGMGMTEEEYKTQVEFLGREPARYEDFVAELAREWKAAKAGE